MEIESLGVHERSWLGGDREQHLGSCEVMAKALRSDSRGLAAVRALRFGSEYNATAGAASPAIRGTGYGGWAGCSRELRPQEGQDCGAESCVFAAAVRQAWVATSAESFRTSFQRPEPTGSSRSRISVLSRLAVIGLRA